jgi:hypothetical protein
MNIYIFGDSHASKIHSQWGRIRLRNVNIICYHIGPNLMYTFGRLGRKLLNIKRYGVRNKDIVIFCFGEIDCRNHVHKHINEDRSYKDIIDDLVCNYFISINKNVKQYKSIKTCVYNIVPPHRFFEISEDHPYPFLGSDEERKLYNNYMNLKIQEHCDINNFIFFDIYKDSCDEDGFLKGNISKDNVHIIDPKPSIKFIKKRLLNL